jgi:spectinomycin phosphotransferase
MKYEPFINHEELAYEINEAYGIKVINLEFIPVGFAAACYKVQSNQEAYFLKLWLTEIDYPQFKIQREKAFRLSRALHDRGIYPYVSYPLHTLQGAFSPFYRRGSFALFPFIAGSPPITFPSSLQDAWVRTLVCLHQATSQLTDVLPSRELFGLEFVEDLEEGLEQIKSLKSNVRPGLYKLRDYLLREESEIRRQLTKLRKLQRRVKQLPSSFVLCHTDMGNDNLLIKNEHLYILDWDEATLAPPEHDLHEARWLGLEHIFLSYQEITKSPLYVDHFAFYLLRRAFSDMTARLTRALTMNMTKAEDEDTLVGIGTWGIQQMKTLDSTLERISSLLV